MKNLKIITIMIILCGILLMPNIVKAEEINDENDATRATGTATPIEEHQVKVITTKVDEDGNPLSGAVLQILDSEGNVVDEWTTDGTEHESLLTEGTYTLHEVSAPEGYKLADDKTFTVKVEVIDIEAGVESSNGPCTHYGPFLYYVEIEGEKYEVYCINQDWETPDENSIYDGAILSPEDIRDFTTQTVLIDPEQHKERKDISDQSLSSQELYDKLLDIIYHRQLASEKFSDLTEAEIRYVTESALKNYTNAGLTRIQGGIRNVNNIPEGAEYWYNEEKGYYEYLYTHFRSFVYNPDAQLGRDVFYISVGNGDAFGTLARHWSLAHGAKNSEAVRAKLARYYELYLYLIGDTDPHPADMYLYIFATENKALDLSGNDFDDGAYQNLLGIHWYNPDDEDNKVYLTVVNEKAPVEKEKKKKTVKKREYKDSYNPQTGDMILSYMIMLPVSLFGSVGGATYLRLSRKES